MFVAMEGQDTFDVVDLFSRLTLDAIGRAGTYEIHSKHTYIVGDTLREHEHNSYYLYIP